MSEDTIYASCEAANDALGPCPRALVGSDGGHWWYCDSEALLDADSEVDWLACECKSCPQKMRLSLDAEEYPV